MNVLLHLDEAVVHIQGRTTLRPLVGVVLGSGLGAFARTLEDATSIPYREIPHFPVSTAVGHQGELVIGTSQGVPVAVMSGRVHYYEGYGAGEIAFPVRVLARFGIRVLILTNAAGGVNVNYSPGDLMIIQDHINLMGVNPLIGHGDEQMGSSFFDMTEPYDSDLAEIAEKACLESGISVRKGVYIAVAGPSYETPAEIRMARTLGADAVGMSTVPEVIAARHMGVRVLGISCITNMAAGITSNKLDHNEVLRVGEQVKSRLIEVLGRVVRETSKRA